MDASYSLLLEYPPLNKPQAFNSSHYTYWKQKMKDFIEATNIDIWNVIESSYEFCKIMIDEVYQPKVKFLFEEEKKGHLRTSKIKWIFLQTHLPQMNTNEFQIIQLPKRCRTT